MTTAHITAHLHAFRFTPDDGEPVPSFQFALSHPNDDDLHVAEEVFALLNSYPSEMHVPATETNLAIVRSYRDGRNLRSLSVGDVVTIERDCTPRHYRVASFGFAEMPNIDERDGHPGA